MINAMLNIRIKKNSTSRGFLCFIISLTHNLSLSLFLWCTFALLIVFISNASTSPLQYFLFHSFVLCNRGKCWEWAESFSFCNQQTSPTSACFHNPCAAAVTHIHRENYSTAPHTQSGTHKHRSTHCLPQQDRVHGGNNHNFNWLLLDTIISLSWRMFPFEHFSILCKLDKVECWE